MRIRNTGLQTLENMNPEPDSNQNKSGNRIRVSDPPHWAAHLPRIPCDLLMIFPYILKAVSLTMVAVQHFLR